MQNTVAIKKPTNTIIVRFDPSCIARGHAFVAGLRRGGKWFPRKSRRNDKQKRAKED